MGVVVVVGVGVGVGMGVGVGVGVGVNVHISIPCHSYNGTTWYQLHIACPCIYFMHVLSSASTMKDVLHVDFVPLGPIKGFQHMTCAKNQDPPTCIGINTDKLLGSVFCNDCR